MIDGDRGRERVIEMEGVVRVIDEWMDRRAYPLQVVEQDVTSNKAIII